MTVHVGYDGWWLRWLLVVMVDACDEHNDAESSLMTVIGPRWLMDLVSGGCQSVTPWWGAYFSSLFHPIFLHFSEKVLKKCSYIYICLFFIPLSSYIPTFFWKSISSYISAFFLQILSLVKPKIIVRKINSLKPQKI